MKTVFSAAAVLALAGAASAAPFQVAGVVFGGSSGSTGLALSSGTYHRSAPLGSTSWLGSRYIAPESDYTWQYYSGTLAGNPTTFVGALGGAAPAPTAWNTVANTPGGDAAPGNAQLGPSQTVLNNGGWFRGLLGFVSSAEATINGFTGDTEAEVAAVLEFCRAQGVDCFLNRHWAEGGAGIEAMAARVAELADSGQSNFKTLYPDGMPLAEKVRTVARSIYGAEDIAFDAIVAKRFEQLEADGFGHFPVCIAKTQYSFSTDATARGAPAGHIVPVREVRLSAGAEFVVAICGDIMTMPGLPRVPAANSIFVNEKGEIEGLF